MQVKVKVQVILSDLKHSEGGVEFMDTDGVQFTGAACLQVQVKVIVKP